jgi:hypothetical protein
VQVLDRHVSEEYVLGVTVSKTQNSPSVNKSVLDIRVKRSSMTCEEFKFKHLAHAL